MILNLGSAANDGNGDKLRAAGRKLNLILGSGVISRTTDAGAASATLGSAYIVPAAATGDFASQDGKIAYHNGSAWEFHAPASGWRIWCQGEGAAGELLIYKSAAWSVFSSGGGGGGSSAYDIRAAFGATPGASDVIERLIIPRAITFPADFAGAGGVVQTNPTSSFVLTVKDDGVSIGTVTVGTGGAFTFATVDNDPQTVAAGSILTLEAPGTPDATVADLDVTLAAETV